jgi:hypothetical protein
VDTKYISCFERNTLFNNVVVLMKNVMLCYVDLLEALYFSMKTGEVIAQGINPKLGP